MQRQATERQTQDTETQADIDTRGHLQHAVGLSAHSHSTAWRQVSPESLNQQTCGVPAVFPGRQAARSHVHARGAVVQYSFPTGKHTWHLGYTCAHMFKCEGYYSRSEDKWMASQRKGRQRVGLTRSRSSLPLPMYMVASTTRWLAEVMLSWCRRGFIAAFTARVCVCVCVCVCRCVNSRCKDGSILGAAPPRGIHSFICTQPGACANAAWVRLASRSRHTLR